MLPDVAVLLPLGIRLFDERYRGHQIQYPSALACLFFGNMQRSHGLAGTAGHDELPAAGLFEAFMACAQCFFLMIPQLAPFAPGDLFGTDVPADIG